MVKIGCYFTNYEDRKYGEGKEKTGLGSQVGNEQGRRNKGVYDLGGLYTSGMDKTREREKKKREKL